MLCTGKHANPPQGASFLAYYCRVRCKVTIFRGSSLNLFTAMVFTLSLLLYSPHHLFLLPYRPLSPSQAVQHQQWGRLLVLWFWPFLFQRFNCQMQTWWMMISYVGLIIAFGSAYYLQKRTDHSVCPAYYLQELFSTLPVAVLALTLWACSPFRHGTLFRKVLPFFKTSNSLSTFSCSSHCSHHLQWLWHWS